MRNSNPNQLSFNAEISPAEWMQIIRKNIKAAESSGADTSHLKRKQNAAFISLKNNFINSSRV